MDLDFFVSKLTSFGNFIKATDLEISKETQTSLRTTQRYLKRLKETGIIRVKTKKYFHHEHGWCNERTVILGEIHGNDISESQDC